MDHTRPGSSRWPRWPVTGHEGRHRHHLSLNHATPGVLLRWSPPQHTGIGQRLIDSGYDYFGGGSIHQATGKKKDQKDSTGWPGGRLLRAPHQDDILAAKPGTKIIAVNPVIDGSNAMPYDMDRTDEQLPR